jgi:hypothetical protein
VSDVCRGLPLPSRVKGRPALVRRLRGLLLAVHRYARHRATSAADRDWSIRVLDGLADVLRQADPHGAPRADSSDERRPHHV